MTLLILVEKKKKKEKKKRKKNGGARMNRRLITCVYRNGVEKANNTTSLNLYYSSIVHNMLNKVQR